MRNYYIVFDQLKMRYGFAPLKGLLNIKSAIVAGTTPSCSYTTYYDSSCIANAAKAADAAADAAAAADVAAGLIIGKILGYFVVTLIVFAIVKECCNKFKNGGQNSKILLVLIQDQKVKS